MRRFRCSATRFCAVTGLLGLAPLTAACTYGEVTDASTGTPPGSALNATLIPGATLVFRQLVNTPVLVEPPPPAALQTELFASSIQTWTAAELAATIPPSLASWAGEYWLNPYAAERAGDATGVGVSQGWNRITVSAPGFDTVYIYRNHQYAQAAVQTATPYSGPGQGGEAPYAVPNNLLAMLTSAATLSNGTGTPLPSLAANENFALSRTTIPIPPICLPFPFGGTTCIATGFFVHPTLPDLIVDVRTLLPTQAGASIASPQEVAIGRGPVDSAGNSAGQGFCCSAGRPAGTLASSTTECLAFPLSVANVGTGRFEVQSNSATLTNVTQVIYDSLGNHTTKATNGSIVATLPGGYHTSLVAMRLRGPIVAGCLSSPPTPGCCDTEATASTCNVVSSNTKAICLEQGGVFDPQIFQTFGKGVMAAPALNGATLNCQASTVVGSSRVVSDSGDIDTGLVPGMAEMYSIGNPYDYLDISHVSPGPYWLEAEINPPDANGNRTYMESDTSNNISRAQITITTPPEGGGGTNRCSP